MRKVEFLDTSLRDGEQTPGVNFSIKEKIATIDVGNWIFKTQPC